MQDTTLTANKAAATANNPSLTPSPTHEPVTPTPAAAPPPSPLGIDSDFLKAIDEFVILLRNCSANSLGWRIMIGVHLHQFRDGLGMDDWNQLLISGRLPFSPRTAQTLARIGKHKVLADIKHAHQLPDALMVLNVIAALPPSVVEEGLRTRSIHPDTTLAEAKNLVVQHRAKKNAGPGQTPMPTLI